VLWFPPQKVLDETHLKSTLFKREYNCADENELKAGVKEILRSDEVRNILGALLSYAK